MTIDSSWLVSFKEELPHAFTEKNAIHPNAVFVDGQIKLMQGPPASPQTWDDFIYRQFGRHLAKFFDVCDVVVLAFDNYEHVPRAKCMTQAKRRKNIPIMPFAAHAELPCMVPEGQAWMHCIANRTFKTRVIDLVLLRLPSVLLQGHPKRRLVLDYHEPVEMRFDANDGLMHSRALADFPVLGEADLKFTRYAGMFGRLLVDSIDGDSIPIALMYHEMCLRQGVTPGLISVYRMELRLPGEAAKQRTATRTAEDPRKRLADGSHKAPEKKKPAVRRAYEYVNIHALYEGLKDVIAQGSGRIALPTHVGHEMGMLISLIALTGTDFSRNMPQMSGRSVYQWMGDLWPTLAMAYDPSECRMRVDVATNLLVGLMYKTKFGRHTVGEEGLRALLARLQGSDAVGARVKQTLPSYERVECTVRNANWVLAYWTCEPSPDPIDELFGFRLLPGGCPAYADTVL